MVLMNILMFVLLGLSFAVVYCFTLWCLKLINKVE